MPETQPQQSTSRLVYNRAKIIIAIVIGILAVIVIFQNTQPVNTRVLFLEFDMPRALLLILVLLAGFIAGAITAAVVLRRRSGR